ncbi:MAG: glycosyltransferase, partial [Clostridia bacterium]|nr:glycosyltransferase [Clostridia bacterium]
MKKIVFTGGGTLGHVMPNIYLFDELKHEFECSYIGGSGIEKEKIKDIMLYYEIPTVKLIRGKILNNFKIPFVLISAIIKAKKILREIRPNVVFSKGGYVALPVCIAARMLKIPIVSHESDASFGLANKIILRVSDVMCVNFKNLENKNKKIVYTGPLFSKEYENNK